MSESTLHNEKELLARVAEGDEMAFSQLFRAYHNRLGSFVMQLTGSLPVTEEIVQDVFLKIWLKREMLTEIDHFNAWVYAVTRNFTFTYLKKLGRELANRQEWEQSQEQDTYSASEPATGFYHELIEQAVTRLPPQQQKVYLLSREEGLRQAEIAERLSISLETVKKHMVLALKTIRTQILDKTDPMITLILLTPLLF